MRVFKDNTEYQGTPEEIAEFLQLREVASSDKQEDTTVFNPDEFLPLVNEAKTVREKLADDPAYNPYGGVVKSKESEDEPSAKAVSADLDTGIEYK